MEVTKGALVRIVKATFIISEMAGHILALTDNKSCWTPADEAKGLLIDAIVSMTGDMRVDDSLVSEDERSKLINDFINMKIGLIPADASANEIANRIIGLCDTVKQPAPVTMERQSFEEMWKRVGGYLYKEAVNGNDHH